MARKRSKRRGNGEGTITQLSDGRWQGRISLPNGRRKAAYGKTFAECRDKLDSLRRQAADGLLLDDDPALAKYLTAWLQGRRHSVKPSTLDRNTRIIQRSIVPHLGKVKLSKLTPAKIQAMMNTVADDVSADAANKARKLLKTALNDAVEGWMLARNPADATKKLKHMQHPMTVWTYPEAARFLSVAEHHRLFALFNLTMFTGLRVSELLGLRWCDVSAKQIHIRHTAVTVQGKLMFAETTKTDSGNRIISVPDDVMAALLDYRGAQQAQYEKQGIIPPHDLVSTTTIGTPISYRNLCRTYKTLQQRAEVTPATAHDMRHWHASMLFQQNWPITEISARLGHANPSVTLQIYAHLIRGSQLKPVSPLEVLPQAPEDVAPALPN